MREFFENYFNIKKIASEKRRYKKQTARVEKLPEDYRYVYKKIREYMWSFTSGAGYDMLEVQYGLVDLFEENAEQGTPVLEVTGNDVAAFADELLKNAKTYTENRREKFNREIHKKLEKQ